jgi:hypothetical protein
MATKPIIDVQHRGKRVRVDFALVQRGIGMKYDIVVNDKPVKVGIFAEAVMRCAGSATNRVTNLAVDHSEQSRDRGLVRGGMLLEFAH